MEMKSPGGFIFGVAGWNYGEAVPKAITFFLDGTTRVSDQHGRPIEGLAGPHAEVIKKLSEGRVDWQSLAAAGWPQVPYAELKKLPRLPDTPAEELRKIKDPALRKDALRARREADEVYAKQLEAAEAE